MPMKTVRSKDGTTIAFDQTGEGSAIILVAGALQHRAMDEGFKRTQELLAAHFTVIHYDRRGRGDSGDTHPFAVEREIEDIEALIDQVGGSACLIGISSGAALAMEAAIHLGGKVKKLAMYEAPYNADPVARQNWVKYRQDLRAALDAGRRDDAVGALYDAGGNACRSSARNASISDVVAVRSRSRRHWLTMPLYWGMNPMSRSTALRKSRCPRSSWTAARAIRLCTSRRSRWRRRCHRVNNGHWKVKRTRLRLKRSRLFWRNSSVHSASSTCATGGWNSLAMPRRYVEAEKIANKGYGLDDGDSPALL